MSNRLSGFELGEHLWTVREVAKFLGFHEKTVYLWVARGELPCVRVGGRLRFRASDLLRWVDAQKG